MVLNIEVCIFQSTALRLKLITYSFSISLSIFKLSTINTLNYNKKVFGGMVGEKFTFQKFPIVHAILLEPPPRSQEKKFKKNLFVPSFELLEVLALLLKSLEMK